MHQFKLILDTSNEYLGQIRNWKDLMPLLQRDQRYRTILPAFSLKQLELTKAAAKYIKDKYEARGVLASTSVEIQRHDGTDFQDYLEGMVDYASYDRDEENLITIVGLRQVDLVSKWLRRDEIETSLQELTDLDNNAITSFTDETIDVTMHNQVYDRFVDAGMSEPTLIPYLTVGAGEAIGDYDAAERDGRHFIQLGTNKYTINEIPEEYFNLPFGYVHQSGDPTTNQLRDLVNNFLEIQRNADFSEDIDITVDLDYDYDVIVSSNTGSPATDGSIKFEYQEYDGVADSKSVTTVDNESLSSWSNIGTDPTDGGRTLYQKTGSVTASFSITISSAAGDDPNDAIKMWFQFDGPTSHPRFNTTTSEKVDITINTLDVNIERQLKYEETNCKGMLVYEAFLRSLQKITGVADPLRSNFYGRTDSEVHTYGSDGAGSKRVVANGFGIRQFPLADHPIYTSFYDLFRAFNALDNIGVGIVTISGTQYISIEPIEDFMDSSQVAFTITDPAQFREYPALEYLFGSVKCGNTRYEQQRETILRSPHTPRIYTTGLDEVIKNEYDAENPAVCSGHLIEQLRQQPYIEGASKDTQYDDDLFIIAVRKSGSDWVSEKDEDFSMVNNIEYPDDQYNLKLTPVRSLIRHSNFLIGGFKRYNDDTAPDKQLRFQKGLGNVLVATRLSSGESENTVENEDISETEGRTPLFIPDFQEYKFPLTQSQWTSLLANPNQVITVSWRGLTKKGFLEMCKVKDGNSMEAEFKTLKIYEP